MQINNAGYTARTTANVLFQGVYGEKKSLKVNNLNNN